MRLRVCVATDNMTFRMFLFFFFLSIIHYDVAGIASNDGVAAIDCDIGCLAFVTTQSSCVDFALYNNNKRICIIMIRWRVRALWYLNFCIEKRQVFVRWFKWHLVNVPHTIWLSIINNNRQVESSQVRIASIHHHHYHHSTYLRSGN